MMRLIQRVTLGAEATPGPSACAGEASLATNKLARWATNRQSLSTQ
jgi:hypothetical protein